MRSVIKYTLPLWFFYPFLSCHLSCQFSSGNVCSKDVFAENHSRALHEVSKTIHYEHRVNWVTLEWQYIHLQVPWHSRFNNLALAFTASSQLQREIQWFHYCVWTELCHAGGDPESQADWGLPVHLQFELVQQQRQNQAG